MRSRQEERSPFTDKAVEQEEYGGRQKVLEFPTGRSARPKDEVPDPGNSRDVNELSDTYSPAGLEQEMTPPPSREEIDAKLEAAETRTEARFAQLAGTLDLRFANLDYKVDRLADSIVRLSTEVTESRREGRAESRTTRITMIVTAIASVLAIVGILLSSQANLLSAFQAGLSAKTSQSSSKP
ncbi:MAG TPA: hypothetical protein VE687_11285 [Stellaceae bacterium]|nr:hypothetical protein [Stellaceae bacterium]